MIVIGIGCRDRGDDAVGPLVVDRLGSSVACFETDGDPSRLVALLGSDPEVVIIESMISGREPGLIDSAEYVLGDRLPGSMEFARRGATHGFGVFEALELARILGSLPERLTLVTVEGTRFAPGSDISPELVHAIDRIVDLVLGWASGTGEGSRR